MRSAKDPREEIIGEEIGDEEADETELVALELLLLLFWGPGVPCIIALISTLQLTGAVDFSVVVLS